ncbi:MAG: GntR family transcriptional regulator [Dactylosporangium sp.]|nr:GntR family transcriptional regulator [Dactylosporangium sp.]NNJ59727.1 GntR family transcriptional regulator [Dactylosporangium sp.]
MGPRSTPWRAYRDIASAIRDRITGGEYPQGARLPSESAWCAEYGVARNTLRRALAQLADEGLITAQPGTGRVVSSQGQTEAAAPQYRRIAAELRAAIESGEFPAGGALPGESALAQRYGVSRGTARQALAELEGADLVVAVHGKGRFVRRR